jgi:hypothetical protein
MKGKNTLWWTYLNVTKVDFSGLDTYYWLNPYASWEFQQKWIQISEIDFFAFLSFK